MKVRKDRKFYVSLALHQAISAELTGHPERVRQLGLDGVQKVLPHNRGQAVSWVREWERALRERDWSVLHHHLTSDDETAAEMRNCTVFLDVLTQQQRRNILTDVYARQDYSAA